MMIRYEVFNQIRSKNNSWGVTKKRSEGNKWRDRHISKNTFGEPEREIIYKKELINGDQITVLQNSFPSILEDRILSSSVRFTDTSGEPTQEDSNKIQYKIYSHRVKADYVITETDVTAEEEEKENKQKQKKVKKRVAERKLTKILDEGKFDFSKPKHVQRAFKRILNYLEVDIEGDEDETEE